MIQPMNRNGSGYFDPTAFQAMKTVLKEGKKMRTGEIWEVEAGKYTSMAIVIADHDRYCSILKLNDSCYGDDIAVNCQGIKYVDCGMISYSFNDKMIDYVRTLKDDEFAKIMASVAKHLGIESSPSETVKEVPVEVVKEVVKEVPSDNTEEFLKAKAEAEVYKRLYDDLIQKMLAGGVNG